MDIQGPPMVPQNQQIIPYHQAPSPPVFNLLPQNFPGPPQSSGAISTPTPILSITLYSQPDGLSAPIPTVYNLYGPLQPPLSLHSLHLLLNGLHPPLELLTSHIPSLGPPLSRQSAIQRGLFKTSSLYALISFLSVKMDPRTSFLLIFYSHRITLISEVELRDNQPVGLSE